MTIYLSFSSAVIDLDSDLDVLVYNMRKPADFEDYEGGVILIDQGGRLVFSSSPSRNFHR